MISKIGKPQQLEAEILPFVLCCLCSETILMSFRLINHGSLAWVQHSAQTLNVRCTETFIQ